MNEQPRSGDHDQPGAAADEARLEAILAAHRLWLETDGTWGARAALDGRDLSGCDLRGLPLARAALAGARLTRCRLDGADLSGCDLCGADLAGARLDGADLAQADLRGAELAGASLARCSLRGCALAGVRGLASCVLHDADLGEASGLEARDLAGADLTGVRLPAPLAGFGQLDQVASICGIARPLFLFVLVTTAFLALTVFSTPDVALFTNAPSAVLPNLATNIPAASLFWVGPIVLIFLYAYLQFYISGIWPPLAELPAVFPDGTTIEQRAHPWLVVRLVRLREGLGALGVRELFAVLLLWGTVPATLLAIWWRYLPLRDVFVTAMHVALVIFSVWLSLTLLERALGTFAGEDRPLPRRRPALGGLAGLMTLVSLLFVFGPNVLDGVKALSGGAEGGEVPEAPGVNPKNVTWLIADLEDGDLSGAIIKDADLRFAYGHRALLVGANLKDSRLRGADFQRADFRRALLEDSGLQETNLDSANFESACLRKADLSRSDMEDVNLRGAYLGLARLHGAYLGRALLDHANLQGADLTGADLSGARLTGTSFYCYALHRHEPDRRRNICPNFEGARLAGARLEDADLRFVQNLTQEQLDGACGSARLPAGLSLAPCRRGPGGPLAAVEGEAPAPAPADNPCRHEMLSDYWIPGNAD